ncbi:hypothetical protein ACF0H5_024131 [Mactra antiquata]
MIKNRKLLIGSPRMARARVLPISTAGSQRGFKSDLKTDAASCLAVTPLGNRNVQKPTQFQNTYKLQPEQTFIGVEIEKAVEKILADFLYDKDYEPAECKLHSQLLSSRILDEIKTMGYQKFKMVCVVSIGSLREKPGMQFGSRCLWNKETDNFISAKYSNSSLFAVAMVYGLFYD